MLLVRLAIILIIGGVLIIGSLCYMFGCADEFTIKFIKNYLSISVIVLFFAYLSSKKKRS